MDKHRIAGLEYDVDDVLRKHRIYKGSDYWWSDGLRVEDHAMGKRIVELLNDSGEFTITRYNPREGLVEFTGRWASKQRVARELVSLAKELSGGASRQAAVVDLFGEREVMAEVQRMVDKVDRPEGDGENKIEGVDLVLLPSSLGLRVSYNDHWGEDTGLLFRFKQSGKPARVDY